jgi:hypothetical protein
MTKSKDKDFVVNAPRVIERGIGEQMDGIALVHPDDDGKPEGAVYVLEKIGRGERI